MHESDRPVRLPVRHQANPADIRDRAYRLMLIQQYLAKSIASILTLASPAIADQLFFTRNAFQAVAAAYKYPHTAHHLSSHLKSHRANGI